MTNFYRTAALSLLALLCLTLVIISAAIWLSSQKTALLPSSESEIDWYHRTEPPGLERENKVIVVENGQRSDQVAFDFILSPDQALPYASFIFYLADPKTVADLADLSGYSAVSFHIRCEPKNVLVFALYTYVEGVTYLERPETYRVSLDFLTCTPEGDDVTFKLRDLDSADWWLERYGLTYTDRTSDLRKVHGFALNNSLQSPKGTEIHVEVSDLVLITEHKNYIFAGLAVVLLGWLAAAYFLVKLYVREQLRFANAQVDANRPLIAYQKLSLSQGSDSLETKLLRHIAVEYANPDINIESTAATLATTRAQINKILKSELGLTYTAYINKLRLTEAARLLTEEPTLSVKQIALGVGFANVTYFNVLFKKEYGCTPKSFRGSSAEDESDE
jgi:AraC-like DNA-binding protein